MLDPPKSANLCLSVVVALILALGVALVMLASCGSPTADVPQIPAPSPPDDSSANVMPTPTVAAKATMPVQEEAAIFVGMWAEGKDLVLELGGNGVYTLSYDFRQPDTGSWLFQEDGSLVLEGQSYVAVPHSNLLLFDADSTGTTLHILHRASEDGNLLAYEPANAAAVPAIGSSAVVVITIDFPSILIAAEGRAGDLGFASESQGRRHIPWRVVVGQDQ